MSKDFNRRPPKNGSEKDWKRWYKQERHNEKPKHNKNRAIDFDKVQDDFDSDLSKFEGVWRQRNSWGLE